MYEYLQFMFLSRNKKKNVYPCKPQFYHINVGFRGGGVSKLYDGGGGCQNYMMKLTSLWDILL